MRVRSEGVRFLEETGRGRITLCRTGFGDPVSYLTYNDLSNMAFDKWCTFMVR